ncbi:response regulator [Zemynaea arenosa]|nr:response regulator [Massilia arenosa]
MPNSVLNVDDNEAGRYAKTRLLRNAGFRVAEAATAAEAMECIAEDPPRLVLLDVKLPDLDGRELCRRIKDDPATSHIKVVHTSAAYITQSDVESGLENGADGYLTSPVEPVELVQTLRSLMQ